MTALMTGRFRRPHVFHTLLQGGVEKFPVEEVAGAGR